MKPNLIKEIEDNYKFRKKIKKEVDAVINLSNTKEKKTVIELSTTSNNGKVRLLDEGAVINGDGSIRFFVKKGTLRNYYDNLSEDYVGSINLGHSDFGSFPFLLGTWTKKDLELVDIGDGRKAIDVQLNLDEESIFVKELKRAGLSIGVSAEFPFEIDREETNRKGFLVVNEVTILDFAIVGDAGNVNSGGITLKKGEKEMTFLEKAKAYLSKNVAEDAKEDEEVKETETKEKEVPEEETSVKETTEKLKAVLNALNGEGEGKTEVENVIEKLLNSNNEKDAEIATLKKEAEGYKDLEKTVAKLTKMFDGITDENFSTSKKQQKEFNPLGE